MSSLRDPANILARLKAFQSQVRDALRRARDAGNLADVARASSADTIYGIDAEVDPLLEAFCNEWSREVPLVLVAEGLQDEAGNEVASRVFPHGFAEKDAEIRV